MDLGEEVAGPEVKKKKMKKLRWTSKKKETNVRCSVNAVVV